MDAVGSGLERVTEKEASVEHQAPITTSSKADPSSFQTKVDSAEGEPATEDEIKNLFHVVDDIPLGVWLAAFVASSERFVWYGATGPIQNYLQHDRRSKIPGALGLEQATATLVMTGFMAFSYFTPILGAIVADAWLAAAGLAVSMFLFCFGCGGVRAAATPFIGISTSHYLCSSRFGND
ncbi:MAG: hypothetical protein Q9179_004088 [Wetmoreana sp. 5 TL-2023]